MDASQNNQTVILVFFLFLRSTLVSGRVLVSSRINIVLRKWERFCRGDITSGDKRGNSLIQPGKRGRLTVSLSLIDGLGSLGWPVWLEFTGQNTGEERAAVREGERQGDRKRGGMKEESKV